jgi:arylformamidase
VAIYDVTVPLRRGMVTYGGNEPGPEVTYTKLLSRGDSSNLSTLFLGSHTGTHVDAPHHFIDGSAMVEEMPLEALVGPVQVVEHASAEHITATDIEAFMVPPDTRRVLFKTSNGQFWDDDAFHAEFVGIEEDAAKALVERGVVLVGIDYLSIERSGSPGHPVHVALLDAGVVIVEGLDLRAVAAGSYTICCAPLKVIGAEGAPARVFLWDELPA